MTNRGSILRAVEIIEDHLKKELPVAKLAQNVGYSQYHFIRLFQGVIGLSPKEYINCRKLTEAAKELIITPGKVTNLAFEYQFNDYETFSRAFKRMFGITPTQCKNLRLGDTIPFVEKFVDKSDSLHYKSSHDEPKLVTFPHLLLVGLASPVRSAWMVAEKWSHFSLEVEAIADRIVPERYYQLAFWPENREMDGFFVMPAVEVRRFSEIPSILVGKTVTGGRYLLFIHRGPRRKVAKTYQYIYEEYLPNSNYTPNRNYNFEYYGSACTDVEDEDLETEIYIPVE